MSDPNHPWPPATTPQDAWHSSLEEALRANGFETSPPPIDDEPEPDPGVRPLAAAPAPDPVAAVAPGSEWWADGEGMIHRAPTIPAVPRFALEPEPEPVLPAPTSPGAADQPSVAPSPTMLRRPAAAPTGVSWSSSLGAAPIASAPIAAAPAVSPTASGVPAAAVPITANRTANAPSTLAGSAPPSPPAFLAGRIGRGAAGADAAAIAAAGPTARTPATPTPAAPMPAATTAQGAPAPAPVVTDPDPAVDAADDPRAAIAWPEPQPLNDERWPSAPQQPVPAAPVWPVEPTADAVDAAPIGFAFDEAWDRAVPEAPLPVDPWAGARFSAAEPVAPATSPAAPAPTPLPDELDELDDLRTQAAAVLAADAARTLAEPVWATADVDAIDEREAVWQRTPDAGSAVPADPWSDVAPWDTPATTTGTASDATAPVASEPPPSTAWDDMPATAQWDAPPAVAEGFVDTGEPAPWDLAATPVTGSGVDWIAPLGTPPEPATPAPAAPPLEWIAPDAPLHAWDTELAETTWVAPPVEPDPVLDIDPTAAAPAVLSTAGSSHPDLDHGRVEFIGYVDPVAAAAPAASSEPGARPITAPKGSILDVGRRPPGARPVDPATLSGASATAASASISDASRAPEPTTPGAVGADLWDLVTAPATPPAVGAQASKGGSRAATLLLTLVVLLVILAIVVGFAYMFLLKT